MSKTSIPEHLRQRVAEAANILSISDKRTLLPYISGISGRNCPNVLLKSGTSLNQGENKHSCWLGESNSRAKSDARQSAS